MLVFEIKVLSLIYLFVCLVWFGLFWFDFFFPHQIVILFSCKASCKASLQIDTKLMQASNIGHLFTLKIDMSNETKVQNILVFIKNESTWIHIQTMPSVRSVGK